MAFEKARGWTKLMCASRRVFGFQSPGATGTHDVICTATRCKRPGYEVRHMFNNATGEYVTEYVPLDASNTDARST